MLVFLDIDGVMVPAKGYKLPEFLADGFAAFNSMSSRALNRLLSDYDATIMLTTSHKDNYSIEQWINLFGKRGINVKRMESLPANIDHLSRKEELVNWFNLHTPSEDFVIIDDDKSLNGLPNYLKDHLILTSSYVGLTEDHLGEINQMVKKNGEVSY